HTVRVHVAHEIFVLRANGAGGGGNGHGAEKVESQGALCPLRQDPSRLPLGQLRCSLPGVFSGARPLRYP
ncbi:MAG: hypothetical protein MUF44_08790, partial [Hydrogenophaga sp.]|nr:hypothetical protein [Hydrogenophaga sp.]